MLKYNKKRKIYIILKKYFKDFTINELRYYLNNYKNETIPDFLINNIYELEDFELNNFVKKYINVIIKKIILFENNKKLFNNIKINISFISDLIYWEDVFSIDNNIFINIFYLNRILKKIKNNEYEEISKIYIIKNNIYDVDLLKNLSKCIYNILNNNLNYYNYKCIFVNISDINFTNKYNINKNPSTKFLDNTITIYKINNKIYGIFNNIISDVSYAPYFEETVIELSYSNGKFYEIKLLTENLLNLMINPFLSEINEIANKLYL